MSNETNKQHDCKAWNTEVWSNDSEYTMTRCGICDSVTRFRWKKWYRQLWSVFWDGITSSKYF